MFRVAVICVISSKTAPLKAFSFVIDTPEFARYKPPNKEAAHRQPFFIPPFAALANIGGRWRRSTRRWRRNSRVLRLVLKR